MSGLLHADFYRMYAKKWFWLCTLAMILIALAFCMMQYTAMDYAVALNRVIFLPMSFYGVVMAALISKFTGDDFSDGVVRNKIIAGKSRAAIYASNMLAGWAACITVYLLTVGFSVGLGIHLFPVNVTVSQTVFYTILGLFTCITYSSLYHMITMLIGNKTTAVVICMSTSFVMLFLCLHTNQILVQSEFKNGVLNPNYVTGTRRVICELLHDFNPTGQAAQLSEMNLLNPVRFVVSDLALAGITCAAGMIGFGRKNIK